MSLSKPFPVFNLPIVPLEHVLLLLDPFDILLIALSSKKVREQLSKLALVKHVDIRVCQSSVVFSFHFKSGKLIKWRFDIKYNENQDKTIGDAGKWLEYSEEPCENEYSDRNFCVFELDGMKIDLLKDSDGIRCRLPMKHFSDYAQRIGNFLVSIFPCRRIRKLGAGILGFYMVAKNPLFHIKNITNCDKFRFFLGDGDHFSEIMEKMNVKKKITLECFRDTESSLEWVNNEKIRNIPHLSLDSVRNLSLTQFLSLENEQLRFWQCNLPVSYLNAYLKKWTNGEFTKRRTLRVTQYGGTRLDDPMILDGLTQESVEPWEETAKPLLVKLPGEHHSRQESVEIWNKTFKPRLVRFSDKLYLNPTPETVPDKYQTVLLKNCHGQFATVVQAKNKFYFAPWDFPIPPINVPVGHKLCQSTRKRIKIISTGHWEISCDFGPVAIIVHQDRPFSTARFDDPYNFPELI